MAKSSPIPQINSTLTRTLIPGLPNDLSAIILSYIPFCYHSRAKQTCKSWRHFYTFSKTLIFELRKSISRSSTLLCVFPDDPSLSSPYLFDPTHLAWAPLPRTPVNPHAYSLSNFSAISVGTHLYVLGGSLFDTRSFPLDRPTASSAVFRFDFVGWGTWETVRPMITPRGSFAVAVERDGRGIVVAGGGSRHPMFGAAGSREGRVERYDVGRDEWVSMPELPGYRAGCVGFTMRRGRDNVEEFWVMGGYGGSTTIAGVLPVDEQCRDLVVMGLGDGEGEWREIGDMWGDGHRGRLGKVAVIDQEEEGSGVLPEVFMLDENADICRFNMALNSWFKETTVPRKNPDGSSFGFMAIEGELHVISLLTGVELSEIRRSRHCKRGTVLSMQIYNPKNKSWRSLVTRTPFQSPLDFKTAVMCTIRL